MSMITGTCLVRVRCVTRVIKAFNRLFRLEVRYIEDEDLYQLSATVTKLWQPINYNQAIN